MIRKLLTPLTALFFLWAAGCGTGPYLPQAKRYENPPKQFTEKILFLDYDASYSLLYIDNRSERLPTGHLKIQMNLQNRHLEDDLWADVQTVFYDANNMRLEETEWQQVAFPAMEVTMYESVSLRTDVVNFTVIIKNARSATGRPLPWRRPPE